jgi:alginate O-acetyltransferase complex protein AlgI
VIFSSIQYLFFLPLVVFLYWRLKGQARLVLTVVASYVFYMSWLPVYGLLLALMTTINWLLSLGIARAVGSVAENQQDTQNQEKSAPSKPLVARLLLGAGLLLNVGALCYYKYANFVFENLARLVHSAANLLPADTVFSHIKLNLEAFHTPLVEAALPLGISFFVFEFVHYLCDVYRGDKAVKSLFEFAAFAAFFPSQIAGPIKRYQDFMPKLRNPLPLTNSLAVEGMSLFMQGLFKKAAIADPLGAIIAQPFATLNTLSAGDAWLAGIGFVVQVYCDFSGYTDMGRGSALLLGIRLPENFKLPLMTRDVTTFWKHWHMSLGSWLRDYVYIPLGGSRCSKFKQGRNLVLTMTACGIWHGGTWHYVLWGVAEGLGLIVHREWCGLLEKYPQALAFFDGKIGAVLNRLMLFAFIIPTYSLFRSPDMPHALNLWAGYFNFGSAFTMTEVVVKSGILVIGGSYLFFWLATEYLRKHETLLDGVIKTAEGSFQNPVRLATWTAAAILMVAAKPLEAVPFVYFQF